MGKDKSYESNNNLFGKVLILLLVGIIIFVVLTSLYVGINGYSVGVFETTTEYGLVAIMEFWFFLIMTLLVLVFPFGVPVLILIVVILYAHAVKSNYDKNIDSIKNKKK